MSGKPNPKRLGIALSQEFDDENLVQVYSIARKEEVIAGMEWYWDAHMVAFEVGGGSISKGAGVLAALSPTLPWDLNVKAAFALSKDLNTRLQSCENVRKAREIMEGGDPLLILGGNKVKSFFGLISRPWDENEVCVDRHAYSAYMGRHINDKEQGYMKESEYRLAQEGYRRVAKYIGIRPSQLQAVVWVTWRRLKNESKAEDFRLTKG